MSHQSEEIPVTGINSPFQEAEVISNKTDNDGHHYLKVLLLSNKKTRNNWIAPYERIGDLPKELLDSFIGLPYIPEHSYEQFNKLQADLFKKGSSDEEILGKLKEHTKYIASPDDPNNQVNYIDHVFTNDPNSSLLYGQLKVMNKQDNDFISRYGRPPKNFTSPGMYGEYKIQDDGTMVYDVNTMRPFHIAGVNVPAFPEHEAKVKGTCTGSSNTCKKVLAYAGFDEPTTSSLSTESPMENVNNNCSCNKNIDKDMSTNNPQVTVTTSETAQVPAEAAAVGNLLKDAQNTTAEAIQAARAEAQKLIDENNRKQIQAPKLQDQPSQDNKEEGGQEDNSEVSRLKSELRKYKQEAEAERNRNLDQYNFILDEVLSVHIPKGHFKKEEDFNAEKESIKSFISKYNISLQDAKWFVIKSAKGIPNQNEEQQTGKENNKKGNQYASLLSTPGTTYSSDIVTGGRSVPKSGSQSESSDIDDYPLGIE